MNDPVAQPASQALWDYIDKKLHTIEHGSYKTDEANFVVSAAIIERLKEVLCLICDPTVVFPTIAPDSENGITASWHAGDYSLDIIVDVDAEVWVIINKPASSTLQIMQLESIKLSEIQHHLTELSDHVKSHNPNWHMLFDA